MPDTVIIGAGIIGASTAYYLMNLLNNDHILDHTVTILDPHPASGASGKAGGFIARNWTGAATQSLAELSFHLHDQLQQEHGGHENWGYRRTRAFSVVAESGLGGEVFKNEGFEWIKGGVIQSKNNLGNVYDCAQWYELVIC